MQVHGGLKARSYKALQNCGVFVKMTLIALTHHISVSYKKELSECCVSFAAHSYHSFTPKKEKKNVAPFCDPYKFTTQYLNEP